MKTLFISAVLAVVLAFGVTGVIARSSVPQATSCYASITIYPNPVSVSYFQHGYQPLTFTIIDSVVPVGDIGNWAVTQNGTTYAGGSFVQHSGGATFYPGIGGVFNYVTGDFIVTASYDGTVFASTTLTVTP